MKPINLCIAEELGVREQQVAAAISLLDGGATVPFVARYRKESTGALDDAQYEPVDDEAPLNRLEGARDPRVRRR
jgi:protein Tex